MRSGFLMEGKKNVTCCWCEEPNAAISRSDTCLKSRCCATDLPDTAAVDQAWRSGRATIQATKLDKVLCVDFMICSVMQVTGWTPSSSGGTWWGEAGTKGEGGGWWWESHVQQKTQQADAEVPVRPGGKQMKHQLDMWKKRKGIIRRSSKGRDLFRRQRRNARDCFEICGTNEDERKRKPGWRWLTTKHTSEFRFKAAFLFH